ncbi:MAG: response regulator [Proteobacteria bacterium]|nr:response regulator [Pseudomonadota bacterium]
MANFKYRILIITGETGTMTVLRQVLREQEYEYENFTSAEKGLQKSISEHFDLIISEVLFEEGKMSGLDLLQKVRENNPDLPFIIISDGSSISHTVKAINYGVTGYLEKPLDQKQSKDTIVKAIRHYKSRFLRNELENYRMDNAYSAVIKSSEQSILKLIETVDNLIELVYPKEYGSFPDLKMAIYECLGNAVEHGNASDVEQRVYFRITMKMDRITVHIKDDGGGFDALTALRNTGDANTKRGLHLINHLMDEVSFNIKGNEINLLKILN